MNKLSFFSRIGNCLTFALYDFLLNGGSFCIEFWNNTRIPHFSVQRNDFVYDFRIETFIIKHYWYYGELRITPVKQFHEFNCRRFLLCRYNKEKI